MGRFNITDEAGWEAFGDSLEKGFEDVMSRGSQKQSIAAAAGSFAVGSLVNCRIEGKVYTGIVDGQDRDGVRVVIKGKEYQVPASDVALLSTSEERPSSAEA